jgi:hypothetical protein
VHRRSHEEIKIFTAEASSLQAMESVSENDRIVILGMRLIEIVGVDVFGVALEQFQEIRGKG